MVKGVTGAALLCLSMPFLWFQWGLLHAVAGAILLIALLAWRTPAIGVSILLLTMILLFRLEGEANHALPGEWQHRQAALRFCLDQPPRQYEDYQTFLGRVTSQPSPLNLRYVRMTAGPEVTVSAGDCLNAEVRLRQPLGRLIPGEFNPTRYYFSERIDAVGSVTKINEVTSGNGLAPRLYRRAETAFTDGDALAIWAALALGWSQTMTPSLADLFNQNQIKHLVVVSGMHVGMVAGWAFFLVYLMGRLPGATIGRPAWLRFVFACGASGAFVMLTGFGFPGVRAWVMLAIPLVLLACGLRLGGHQVLALAAVAINLIRPQAWLSSGAWLSFGLVWVLIRMSERWRSENLPNWRLAIRLQVGLALLMIPVSVLMGFDWHPLSIPINLVMIPLVTLVILPWSLLILLAPTLTWVSGYEVLVEHMLRLLTLIAPWHSGAPDWPMLHLALVVLGLALAASQLFSGLYRWLLSPLLVLVLLFPLAPEAPEEFRMTVLDVGHGEALVLQWPDQTWLYDTAGQWSNGQSVAAHRLAAWFRRHSIEVDGVIVSHSDIDHAGGVAWATDQWPKAARWSGEPKAVATLSKTRGWQSCHQASVDENLMTWLPVPPVFQTNNNDRSCVVAVPTSAGPVLITGDASRMVEYWLIQAFPDLFPVGVQVIGHHGSHTSSARAFLDASPEAVFVVSSGDRAMPRWPNLALQAYLSERQRPLLNTAQRGTLEVNIVRGEIIIRDWSSAYRRRLIKQL